MRPLTHERRILLFALLGALPAVLAALGLLWTGGLPPGLRWLLSLVILASWIGGAVAIQKRVVYPLQTVANLLGALGEGDFSLRGRRDSPEDALGQVLFEINSLSATLQSQRLEAVEATALLRTVIDGIDVAVFAFDHHGPMSRLKMVNRAGERILAQSAQRLLERPADDLGLSDWLAGESQRTVQRTFPGAAGRWAVRRGTFRLDGHPHQLLVITDVSRALRDEERQAWRRLIRVLGHELNNSLAPIKSTAETLRSVARRDSKPPDWEQDLTSGLQLIGQRARSLSRFVADYARLARLPEPALVPVDVNAWVRRTAALENRLEVVVENGPEVSIPADAAQLEQLLINLLRNAVDAALETGGGVQVGWKSDPKAVEIWVRDEGPGLGSTENLFVPFYTTKPGGTGIGLVLSQQIAEAHGGSLTLENRPGSESEESRGCEARLRLPR